MGKQQQMIKLFVVLLVGTAFIFSFTHFGVKAFQNLNRLDGKFSDGTTIGSLDLSGKSDSEATSLLEEKYVEWLKGTKLNLQYGEKTASFDMNQFHLNTHQTLNAAKEGKSNLATITVNKSQVSEQLEILFPQLNLEEIDVDKLANRLNETASQFVEGEQSFNLTPDFVLAGQQIQEETVNFTVMNLKEVPFDLQSIIEHNPTIEIPKGSTFSLLDFARKQKISGEDSLNVLATGIYQAILPTNFTIVERNISNSLPNYAGLGFEAKVNQSAKTDLVITNPNKTNYRLEFKLVGDQFTISLIGQQFVYRYQIVQKDYQELHPKTIIQYSPLLKSGQTKIVTKGMNGQIVKIYREIYQGNQLVNSELISEDYYPPIYRVEIHGLDGNTQTTTQTTIDPAATQSANSTREDQSTLVSENDQTNTTESDIWGKPNEQPK
ncbi:G5 domain-containing protein [Neobacillus sp. LXY-1]|uniref:G5 domain-containing protein n=1 Tax=Neobacillus sp. LXY-1 TaxID=3379133 RepID=UPI003EE01814